VTCFQQPLVQSSFDDVADKVFGKDDQPHDRLMDAQALREHCKAEAEALRKWKGKIKTAQSYLGTPHEQNNLPDYMKKARTDPGRDPQSWRRRRGRRSGID
jgi:hypothetical protein